MNDTTQAAPTTANGAKPPVTATPTEKPNVTKASPKKPATKAKAKTPSKKKPVKAAAKTKAKTTTGAKRGPRGQYLDKKVTILCAGNPCREGTTQHKYFAALKNGQTIRAAVERGYANVMTPVYVKRGYIKLS